MKTMLDLVFILATAGAVTAAVVRVARMWAILGSGRE